MYMFLKPIRLSSPEYFRSDVESPIRYTVISVSQGCFGINGVTIVWSLVIGHFPPGGEDIPYCDS